MPAKGQTSREYFNQLTILHGALLIAQVVFVCVAYYLVATGDFGQSADLTSVFQIVGSVLAVGGFAASVFITKMLLRGIIPKKNLSEKLSAYKGPLLIRWALLEMPAMFSIVGYLLTGNYFFLVLAVLLIVLFILNRPTPSAACTDLELSGSDKILVENPDGVVSEISTPD